MSRILSPIKFLKSNLLGISLDISDRLLSEGKIDPETTKVGLGVERSSTISSNDDKLFCDCTMSVELDLLDSEGEDDTEKPLVTFSCTARALAASPEMAEDPKLSEDILEANTISFIWAKMRSWFEVLSVDTPIAKKLTLPALDPYALLENEEKVD